MEQQQTRWQQLYGPNGKLGFTNDWDKNFLPDGQDDRLTELESISLEGATPAMKVESDDQTHDRKLTILKKLVEQTQ